MGSYAIPLALSVVHGVSSVSTITTRNNKDIKFICGANVHHVPGLCLLGIGGDSRLIGCCIMVIKDLGTLLTTPC